MNEHPPEDIPIAYLITMRSYGTWLHGDEKTSVDRHGFNIFDTPRLSSQPKLQNFMRHELKNQPMLFNRKRRLCILDAIKEVCEFRGYESLAVNIRSNHLHAVIASQASPDKIVNDFKSYATRKLRQSNLVGQDAKVWVRGKSGRYLWKPRHVEMAIDYVLFGQGDTIPDFD